MKLSLKKICKVSQFQNTIEEAWEDRALLADKNVQEAIRSVIDQLDKGCLLYTSPSPRDLAVSRMPSSA